MKTDEELAEFITQNPLAWRIWMTGYEAGLAQGHQDERATTDQLADMTARRILTLQDLEVQVRTNIKNTLSMERVFNAREQTTVGTYRGGPVEWD